MKIVDVLLYEMANINNDVAQQIADLANAKKYDEAAALILQNNPGAKSIPGDVTKLLKFGVKGPAYKNLKATLQGKAAESGNARKTDVRTVKKEVKASEEEKEEGLPIEKQVTQKIRRALSSIEEVKAEIEEVFPELTDRDDDRDPRDMKVGGFKKQPSSTGHLDINIDRFKDYLSQNKNARKSRVDEFGKSRTLSTHYERINDAVLFFNKKAEEINRLKAQGKLTQQHLNDIEEIKEFNRKIVRKTHVAARGKTVNEATEENLGDAVSSRMNKSTLLNSVLNKYRGGKPINAGELKKFKKILEESLKNLEDESQIEDLEKSIAAAKENGRMEYAKKLEAERPFAQKKAENAQKERIEIKAFLKAYESAGIDKMKVSQMVDQSTVERLLDGLSKSYGGSYRSVNTDIYNKLLNKITDGRKKKLEESGILGIDKVKEAMKIVFSTTIKESERAKKIKELNLSPKEKEELNKKVMAKLSRARKASVNTDKIFESKEKVRDSVIDRIYTILRSNMNEGQQVAAIRAIKPKPTDAEWDIVTDQIERLLMSIKYSGNSD